MGSEHRKTSPQIGMDPVCRVGSREVWFSINRGQAHEPYQTPGALAVDLMALARKARIICRDP